VSGDFTLVVIKSKKKVCNKPKGLNFTLPTTIFAVSTGSDLVPNLCDFSLHLDIFSDSAKLRPIFLHFDLSWLRGCHSHFLTVSRIIVLLFFIKGALEELDRNERNKKR